MKRFLIMIYACLLFNGNVLAGTKVRVEMQPNSFENPTSLVFHGSEKCPGRQKSF